MAVDKFNRVKHIFLSNSTLGNKNVQLCQKSITKQVKRKIKDILIYLTGKLLHFFF